MKRKGDGWTQIKREVCPFCGKKGYYDDFIDSLMKRWRCMYCKKRGDAPNPTMGKKYNLCNLCGILNDDEVNNHEQSNKHQYALRRMDEKMVAKIKRGD